MESLDNKMDVLLNNDRLNRLRDELANAGSDIARIGSIIQQIRQIDPMFNRNWVVGETNSDSDSS